MTALDALIDELATRVADKVEARLRARPVIQPRLLSVDDAAVYIGLSSDAVRKMLVTGKVRATKIDGRTHIDIKDLETLIVNGQ